MSLKGKMHSFSLYSLTAWQQQPLFTLFRKNKKEEGKETIENNIIKGIYNCTYSFWVIVCNSQSSKAFELAAAYLQLKKGTKERNNN